MTALNEAGVDVHAKDVTGLNGLHHTAKRSRIDLMRSLKQWGVDARAGYPLAIIVARYGNLDTVCELREWGNDFRATDGRGFTAIHVAAEAGRTQTVRKLILWGVDIHARTHANSEQKYRGWNAAFFATASGNLDTWQELYRHGIDTNAVDGHGRNLIHVACWHCHVDSLRELYRIGVDPDAQATYGIRGIHLAAQMRHIGILRELIQMGVDVHAIDQSGRNSVSYAVSPRRTPPNYKSGACIDVLNELHRCGVDFSTASPSSKTPLECAIVDQEKRRITKTLAECVPNYHEVEDEGGKIVKQLILKGANIHPGSANGVLSKKYREELTDWAESRLLQHHTYMSVVLPAIHRSRPHTTQWWWPNGGRRNHLARLAGLPGLTALLAEYVGACFGTERVELERTLGEWLKEDVCDVPSMLK